MAFDLQRPWLTLDDWQKKYIKTEGNCFVCCARQSGKSAACAIKFGEIAATQNNRTILVIAYTEKQAYSLFFKILMYLQARYLNKIAKSAKLKPTKHEINLTNGSKIMCHAAGETGLGLRGYTCTHVVVDECAAMSDEIFQAISPMISVTGGSIDLLSTPQGKEGYFYRCSDDISLGDKVRKDFTRFYISAEDCPRHSKEFLESERKSMTPLSYAREYLAKFLDEFKRVFSDDWIKDVCVQPRGSGLNGKFYMGCDLARMGGDFITCETLKKISKDKVIQVDSVAVQYLKTNETEELIIREASKYGNNLKVIALDVGAGTLGCSIFDHLILPQSPVKRKVVAINNRDRVLDVNGEKTGRILKEDMYNRLLAWGYWGYIKLLNDDEVKASLASCLYEKGRNENVIITGNSTHIVEGIIRALWAATEDKSLDLWVR